MEEVQSAFRKISKDTSWSNSSASLDSPSASLPTPSPLAASSSTSSGVLLTRPPRQLVSIWTCSKLCAACFVAGVFVGYTLKRQVRRWLSNLLKKLKDD